MTTRRKLNLKLAFCILTAFTLSLAFSWFLHDRLSERDAYALIERTFENVQDELTDCIDERLVLVCMAARERIEDGHPDDPESLRRLARELRVTEISVVDAKGDIVRSSVEEYLARPGKPAYNFAAADDEDANEMMGLVSGRYSEYCQPFRYNAANDNWRKFIGVWRHEGGFFEIGCDAKSLQSLARSTCMDLFANWHVAHAFEEVNNALSEGNSSCTFVTAWAGELNTRTGHVTFVNAGHNPPVAIRGGKAELLKSRPSLALGAMAGVRYRVGEIQLDPGDGIYLYTDGIVEQPDKSEALYGEGRLLRTLSNPARSGKEILDAVLDDVRQYSDGVEQADDRTQLLIRYRGEPTVVSREYAPTMEDLARATDDLAAALEPVPDKAKNKLLIAADEIFANIVRHSSATHWSLSVVLTHHPDGVRLVISDDGKPFDPLIHRDPDTTLSAAERDVGGLGILIVKKTMSPVTYKRRNGTNILSIGKDYGN